MWFWIRCEELDPQLVLLHLPRWRNHPISERLPLLLENSWKDNKSVTLLRLWTRASSEVSQIYQRNQCNGPYYGIELLKVKIAATEAATNARNIHKDQSAKVLQTGGILYAKEARSMTCDRLGLENLRQKARDERTEKQCINELIKVYKRCKIHIKVWQKEEKVWKVLYKAVLKKLLVIQPFQK